MTVPGDNINHELLVLTESFANGGIGPAEFRRRRRELVCSWTGEALPPLEQVGLSEDDTQPALPAITDEDVAAAKSATEPAVEPPVFAPVSKTLSVWATVLLLTLAVSGAGAVLWFVLRRSV